MNGWKSSQPRSPGPARSPDRRGPVEQHQYQFPTRDNLILLAVVLMGGIYSIWGAIVAGLLFRYLPALLDTWGLPADLLTILFGVGILQVLLTAPGGLVDQFPKDMARLGRFIGRKAGGAASVVRRT
jgi:hypothetical protein